MLRELFQYSLKKRNNVINVVRCSSHLIVYQIERAQKTITINYVHTRQALEKSIVHKSNKNVTESLKRKKREHWA